MFLYCYYLEIQSFYSLRTLGATKTFNNENMILITDDINAGITHNYSLNIFYKEPGFDQSKDMGKRLNLIVQIYLVDETVDLNGKITGVDETYSLKLESVPKLSTIKKTDNGYEYSFKGVEVG